MLQRVEKTIIWLEHNICLLCLVIMVFSVGMQVLSRYLFKTPVSWADETARSSLTWLTFIGGSMAVRLKSHFVIELLVHSLPKATQNFFEIVLLLVTAILLAVMFYTGIIMLPLVHSQTSSAMGFPMSIVYTSIPLGSFFMFFHVCKFIYQRMTKQYIDTDPILDAEEN
ncbi:2,3-diketo-L-gulonate TRAP transporter permease [Betaproteobacteria bacterium]|nr:2,3-diketo-L-gulonate TRAP transporter permease [Betaproteobacteria bacterium]